MASNHRELLSELITVLETEERPFYEAEAQFNYCLHIVLFGFGLFFSVATAVIAEVIDGVQFEHGGRWALTILPIVVTAISTVSNFFKPAEKENLREYGRIELEDIIWNARSYLSSSGDNEEEAKKSFHAVRQRATELAAKQHRLDVSIKLSDGNFVEKAMSK